MNGGNTNCFYANRGYTGTYRDFYRVAFSYSVQL
jgi:hypothetical protein